MADEKLSALATLGRDINATDIVYVVDIPNSPAKKATGDELYGGFKTLNTLEANAPTVWGAAALQFTRTIDGESFEPALGYSQTTSDKTIMNMNYAEDALGATWISVKTRGASTVSPADIKENDVVHRFVKAVFFNTAFRNIAEHRVEIDDKPLGTYVPSSQIWSTRGTGDADSVDRLRLDNAGNLLKLDSGNEHLYMNGLQTPGWDNGSMYLTFKTLDDIELTAGNIMAADGSGIITTDGTELIDVTVVGAGGMQAAAVQNTWYECYVIADSSGVETTTGYAVKSGDAFVFPTGYDQKRVLGHQRINGAFQWFNFRQVPYIGSRETMWESASSVHQPLTAGAATVATAFSMIDSIPPNAQVCFLLADNIAATAESYVASFPAAPIADMSQHIIKAGRIVEFKIAVKITTGPLVQDLYYGSTVAGDLYIATKGWSELI